MNSQQTSIYAMFIRTLRVLDDNKPVWAANVKFTNNYNTFAGNLTALATAQKEQEGDKTGITQDKDTLREALEAEAFVLASGIRSYAADENNRELEQAVKVTESGLARLPETRLISASEMIHAHGTAHVAALADYGITAETLTGFKAAIDSFKNAQPETRLAINIGAQATVHMRKLFTATSDLLKRQLDTKMIAFKKTNEDFYNAYFSARNIIEQGVGGKEGESEGKK